MPYGHGTYVLSGFEVLSSTSSNKFKFFWFCVLAVLFVIEKRVKHVWVTDIFKMNAFLIILQVLQVQNVCEKLYQFWIRIWGVFLGENNGNPFSDLSNNFLIRFWAFFSRQKFKVYIYELKGVSDYRGIQNYWYGYTENRIWFRLCFCEKSVELDHSGFWVTGYQLFIPSY